MNRRGTTWRKLEPEVQAATNRDNVVALLLEYPATIKRPVLDIDNVISVGFKSEYYENIFNSLSACNSKSKS